MTKPIGQTFFVKELSAQNGGAAGVFVTKVDIYFKQVSATRGIQLQIRETENGTITPRTIPFADKVVFPVAPTVVYENLTDQEKAIYDLKYSNLAVASDDASLPTSFVFDTPVFLESNKLYGLVLIPAGGTPDYLVWAGKINEPDVANTNATISSNFEIGDLFLSSNDLSWRAVYDEDIKFKIYIANFTETEGTAVFEEKNVEAIVVGDIVNTFVDLEPVLFGYSPTKTTVAVLNVSSISGTFNTSDRVYQTDVNNNKSYGVVYFSNSSVIKLSNTFGTFSNTVTLFNSSSTSNATVTNVNQYISIDTTSNSVSVPDSSIFAVNDMIYIMTSNRNSVDYYTVTGITSNTTIQINSNGSFADNSAVVGKILSSNGTYLFGNLRVGGDRKYNTAETLYTYFVYNSIANTSLNLNMLGLIPGPNGHFEYEQGVNAADRPILNPIVFGSYSKASAQISRYTTRSYETLTPNFLTFSPANTNLDFSFKGLKKSTKQMDINALTVDNDHINQLIDTGRYKLSRSQQISYLNSNPDFIFNVNLSTENSKLSPILDTINPVIDMTKNRISTERDLKGAFLTFNVSNTSYFEPFTLITQTIGGLTSNAVVIESNSTMAMVRSVQGQIVNGAISSTLGQTATAINVVPFSETDGVSVNKISSRYISKRVSLTQDSEDIKILTTAFIPALTNVLAFVKITSAADNEIFDAKDWSKLINISSPGLVSSSVNSDDRYEYTYDFNTSEMVFQNSSIVSTTSQNLYCTSTSNFSQNEFIYITDSTSNSFNVREILHIVNATCMVLDRNPSFNSSNAAVGIIPGIESTTSAFLYDQNDNIVRYCTLNDNVFDGFNQFAIKLVLTNDDGRSPISPKVSDLRAIALLK